MLTASNIYVRRKSYKVDRAPTTAHVINSSPVSAARFSALLIRAARDRKKGKKSGEKSDWREWRKDWTLIFVGIQVGGTLLSIYFLLNKSNMKILFIWNKFNLLFRILKTPENLAIYWCNCICYVPEKNQTGVVLMNLKIWYCKCTESLNPLFRSYTERTHGFAAKVSKNLVRYRFENNFIWIKIMKYI